MDIQLRAGAEFDFGTFLFTQENIIEFARANDPLEFHLSAELAKKHFFKELVASGRQPLHEFYIREWIPRFGKTVLAGLGVEVWRFLKPVHPGDQIHCRVIISEATRHAEYGSIKVRWSFNFWNARKELVQHLEMLVLHKDFT